MRSLELLLVGEGVDVGVILKMVAWKHVHLSVVVKMILKTTCVCWACFE